MLLGLRNDPKRPFVAVLGGAKISDKLGVVEALLDVVDALVVGGAMCFTFFAAQGNSIGDSLFEPDQVDTCRRLLDDAARRTGKTIHLPERHRRARRRRRAAPRSAPVCPTAPRASTSGPGRRRRSPTSSSTPAPCSGTARWACSRTSASPPARAPSPRRWPTRRRSRWSAAATPQPRSPSSASTTTSTTSPPAAARRSSCSSSATCPGSLRCARANGVSAMEERRAGRSSPATGRCTTTTSRRSRLVQKLAYLVTKEMTADVDVSVHPPFTDMRSIQTLIDVRRSALRPRRPALSLGGQRSVHRRGVTGVPRQARRAST